MQDGPSVERCSITKLKLLRKCDENAINAKTFLIDQLYTHVSSMFGQYLRFHSDNNILRAGSNLIHQSTPANVCTMQNATSTSAEIALLQHMIRCSLRDKPMDC